MIYISEDFLVATVLQNHLTGDVTNQALLVQYARSASPNRHHSYG